MRFIRITLIVSIVFTLGCGGGDDGPPPNNNPTEDGTASADIVQVDPNADKWINTPESCDFDPAKEGKADGDHIANFGLKGYIDGVKQDFYLHSTCGDEYKAIWIILATGW